MLWVRFEHPKEWQILGILRYGQQAHSPIRRYIKETSQVKASALGCVFLRMVFYIYSFNLQRFPITYIRRFLHHFNLCPPGPSTLRLQQRRVHQRGLERYQDALWQYKSQRSDESWSVWPRFQIGVSHHRWDNYYIFTRPRLIILPLINNGSKSWQN